MIYKKFLILIISSFIVSFFIPNYAFASDLIFSDNFDSQNLDKWTALKGSKSGWFFKDGMIGTRILSPGTVYELAPADSYWSDDYGNYLVEYDYFPVEGVDKNFTFRFITQSEWYDIHHTVDGNGFYSFYLDRVYPNNSASLFKVRYSDLFGGDNSGMKNGILYHVELTVKDEQIKICIESESEDKYCPIDYVDVNTPLIKGKILLTVSTGSVYPTEIYFDNVTVRNLDSKGFNLPFAYPGREDVDEETFRNTFWERMTALFDHEFDENIFTTFLGDTRSFPADPKYLDHKSCPSPEDCYDSHNGIDFSSQKGEEALAADNGEVAYASIQTTEVSPNTEEIKESCKPLSGDGFGCVVVIKHSDTLYSMYAHLKRVFVQDGDAVTQDTVLGNMGNTGCNKNGNGCDKHLHFAAMQPKLSGITAAKFLSRSGWETLLKAAGENENNGNSEKDKEIKNPYKKYKPFCNYSAEGATFTFQDPSGWYGSEPDPWEDDCGVSSPLLWKYSVKI